DWLVGNRPVLICWNGDDYRRGGARRHFATRRTAFIGRSVASETRNDRSEYGARVVSFRRMALVAFRGVTVQAKYFQAISVQSRSRELECAAEDCVFHH